MPTHPTTRHSPTLTLLAVIAVFLAPAPTPAAAQDRPPDIEITGSPTLYVADRDGSEPNAPTAWIVFRTRERVNPRLLVAQVDGRSGRSYRVEDTGTCVRSTVVGLGGRAALVPGRRYRVEIFARSGIGRSSSREHVLGRTVTAKRFAVASGRRTAPGCTSTGADRPSTTAAMRKGIRDFARSVDGRANRIAVSCRPAPNVGDVGRCSGTFDVRRENSTARYRLASRARVFRNTPDSLEYRVDARTASRRSGFPFRTSLTGYL